MEDAPQQDTIEQLQEENKRLHQQIFDEKQNFQKKCEELTSAQLAISEHVHVRDILNEQYISLKKSLLDKNEDLLHKYLEECAKDKTVLGAIKRWFGYEK